MLALIALLASPAAFADDRDPDAITPTVSTHDLAALISRGQPLLLFDVREPVEFAVSHIANAIQINPREPYGDFIARYGARVNGSTVVFYCTAGTRSAEFALGVEDELLKQGALTVNVLGGALITWHNERRPLIDASGQTKFIHPFLRELLVRLKRPELAKFHANK